jgi:hypothetical protein
MDIGSFYLVSSQQIIPIASQGIGCLLNCLRLQEAANFWQNGAFIDDLGTGRVEFIILRIFVIPQDEDDLLALARRKFKLDVM